MDVGTYGGVTKVAFGDSLKESRLAHICKTDLQILSVVFNGLEKLLQQQKQTGGTYDSTLQVITRPAQQELLLLDGLLGRHFLLCGERTFLCGCYGCRGRGRGE